MLISFPPSTIRFEVKKQKFREKNFDMEYWEGFTTFKLASPPLVRRKEKNIMRSVLKLNVDSFSGSIEHLTKV